MRVTLSIDDQTLARARLLAQRRGTSLNLMIREYLESLIASDSAQAVAELDRLWNEEEGDSVGWTWNREEAYDRPVLRTSRRTDELRRARNREPLQNLAKLTAIWVTPRVPYSTKHSIPFPTPRPS
jgi:succinate dehydrogenase flavin-adding protein (antitoxin of CptAB toxin-antitoxin module)